MNTSSALTSVQSLLQSLRNDGLQYDKVWQLIGQHLASYDKVGFVLQAEALGHAIELLSESEQAQLSVEDIQLILATYIRMPWASYDDHFIHMVSPMYAFVKGLQTRPDVASITLLPEFFNSCFARMAVMAYAVVIDREPVRRAALWSRVVFWSNGRYASIPSEDVSVVSVLNGSDVDVSSVSEDTSRKGSWIAEMFPSTQVLIPSMQHALLPKMASTPVARPNPRGWYFNNHEL